jgi:hypothetical protein
MSKKLKSPRFYKTKGYKKLISLLLEMDSTQRDFCHHNSVFVSGKILLDDRQEFMLDQRDIIIFKNIFYRAFARIPLKSILLQLWYIN